MTDISHHSLRKTALQWSREVQLRRSVNAFAEISSVGLDVAKKFYTTDPSRRRAEILFRNISRELEKDAQLAVAMGLRNETLPASIADVQSALAEGRIDDAKRLLESIQAKQTA